VIGNHRFNAASENWEGIQRERVRVIHLIYSQNDNENRLIMTKEEEKNNLAAEIDLKNMTSPTEN